MNALSTEVKPCHFSLVIKILEFLHELYQKSIYFNYISKFAFWILSFCQFTGEFKDFQDSQNPETWKPGNY